MSRFAAATDTANVSIGDDFKPIRIGIDKTSKQLSKALEKMGLPVLSKKNRLAALYRKWREGRLSPETAKLVYRDHKEEFDAWMAAEKN